jgi:hypothetical protein
MLDKIRVQQRKDVLIGAAFSAWLQGAGDKKSFDEFLRHYGLVEKEKPVTKEVKKAKIKKAMSIAERIMKMDRKRK